MLEQKNIETKIEKSLSRALLLDGKMEQGLYKFELEEHIEYWKDGLKKDKEDFVFIVTVNNGDVAMLLITKEVELFINEKAREKLKLFLKTNYQSNINLLLPNMVKDLINDCFALTGAKII